MPVGNPGRGAAVRLVWHDARLREMVLGRDGEVARDVNRRARAVMRRLKSTGPILSGTLRRSWRLTQMETGRSGPSQGVETDVPYIWPVVSGRKAVKPVSARALRFSVGGGALFRMSAKETSANRFVEEAVDAALE